MKVDLFKILAVSGVVWVGLVAFLFVVGLMLEGATRENLRTSTQMASVVAASFGIFVAVFYLALVIVS